ncbi:hypothetical protein [Leptolyngbya sp. O-77]|uniref:hypothetical protein n=1 Tax=Leptolyngbya sp. O-77 TaxID=1080068 RepID=UPI0015613FAE|nr:hypothetical protein [Leptolyngbya sp. O-77]
MLVTRLVSLIQKSRRKFYSIAAFVATLSLIACVHQPPGSIEKINLPSKPLAYPSTHSVIHVDGSVSPNNVLQAVDREPNHVELNHNAVLLTPAGTVSSGGDRIVKIANRLTQNGLQEQSTVTVLDSEGNRLVNQELPWLVGPVKFSPDGSKIITSGSDRTTRIWDNQLNPIASFEGHQAPVQSLQVSPDGNYILTIEYPDIIPSHQQGNQVIVGRLLNLQAVQLASFEGLQHGYMQFSSDSQKLLAVIDGAVQIFDLKGSLQQTLKQDQQEFHIAQFSPDGRSVLAAGSGMMKLWDLQGQLKAEFDHWTLNPEEVVSSICLGNQGEVITGSSAGILRFWEFGSNQIVTVKAHEGQIHAIAISPNGTQIATLGEKKINATGDSQIRVWNRQGDLLEILEEDASTLLREGTIDQLTSSFSLKFTPDAAQIMAAETGQVGTTFRWTL